MESQLDKLVRNLKSDEYWTSTTIYRPSRRKGFCVFSAFDNIMLCIVIWEKFFSIAL